MRQKSPPPCSGRALMHSEAISSALAMATRGAVHAAFFTDEGGFAAVGAEVGMDGRLQVKLGNLLNLGQHGFVALEDITLIGLIKFIPFLNGYT